MPTDNIELEMKEIKNDIKEINFKLSETDKRMTISEIKYDTMMEKLIDTQNTLAKLTEKSDSRLDEHDKLILKIESSANDKASKNWEKAFYTVIGVVISIGTMIVGKFIK